MTSVSKKDVPEFARERLQLEYFKYFCDVFGQVAPQAFAELLNLTDMSAERFRALAILRGPNAGLGVFRAFWASVGAWAERYNIVQQDIIVAAGMTLQWAVWADQARADAKYPDLVLPRPTTLTSWAQIDPALDARGQRVVAISPYTVTQEKTVTIKLPDQLTTLEWNPDLESPAALKKRAKNEYGRS